MAATNNHSDFFGTSRSLKGARKGDAARIAPDERPISIDCGSPSNKDLRICHKLFALAAFRAMMADYQGEELARLCHDAVW
jgi:hypothetical protein